MATEMLGQKEDLHEVEWVLNQTKSALSSLQKEVLYTKNGNDVKFDVNTSVAYLTTLKDKKTYKEVMAQNSGATVMAIQILLKNQGYNVGKIDGVLKSPGKATSNTMEGIKEFQRKNGLYPDGAPGPLTIKKLLEKYGNVAGNNVPDNGEQVKDLTEAEYYALCNKTSLTDDEVKQVVNYNINVNNDSNSHSTDALYLSLTSLTDKQAEELSRVERVELNGLTNITNKQAEELSKVEILNLKGIKTITDELAKYLGNSPDLFLGLDGLTSITDKQAEELSSVGSLSLDGLTSITDKQAESLSKIEDTLSLDGLTSITDKQAESLSKIEETLYLDGLTNITDKQAENLSKIAGMLDLYGLTSITDKQATELAKVEYLIINEDILTPQQKQILKKHIE